MHAQPLKLIIGTDCYVPRWDGIAKFLTEIIPHLPYEVEVIAPNYGSPTQLHSKLGLPVKVHHMPLTRWRIGGFYLSKPKGVEEIVRNADLVWTHTIGPVGGATIRAAHKLHKPLASYVHAIDWELAPRSLASFNPLKHIAGYLATRRAAHTYTQSDIVMVPSQEIGQLFTFKNIHVPSTVIPLGIKTQDYIPANKQNAKQALGLRNKPVITYVGRLSREKDVQTLLKAYKSLQSKATLLIVGSGITELEKQLAYPGIVHAGSQDNVIPYLQATDIFVMPSLTETTSLATLEAMSCGAVPVVTPVGLMKHYIKDKQNGFFFPPKNNFVLGLKLRWLLNDQHLSNKLSEHARQTVLNDFSWDQTVSQVLQTLRTLHEEEHTTF